MSAPEGILLGYSGHAYVVAEAALLNGVNLLGYFEKAAKLHNPFNLQYLGNEQDESVLRTYLNKAMILPGIGDNSIRQQVLLSLAKFGFLLATVVHPKASVSAFATVQPGTFVANRAIINPFASIGKGSIINTGAIVEHECLLHDFVHLAPGAVLAGNVQVGEGAFIGANAVVRQHIRIGRWSTIGAGAVVVKDVPDYTVVAGNPAKPLA
ncbi:MAG: acetyltransferase [Saprospiraceae bacterium]